MRPLRRPRDRVVGWRIARGAIPTERQAEIDGPWVLCVVPVVLVVLVVPVWHLIRNVERQLGQPRTAVTHSEAPPTTSP